METWFQPNFLPQSLLVSNTEENCNQNSTNVHYVCSAILGKICHVVLIIQLSKSQLINHSFTTSIIVIAVICHQNAYHGL